MNFLTLDLELNQPSGALIQVGYVIGNVHTGEVHERIRRYVSTSETLAPRIVQLTGITDEQLATQGLCLSEIYKEMGELHAKYGCFRNAITWGGGDSAELRTALGLDDHSFLLGRRWIDAKTLYTSYCLANGLKMQSGLAKSLGKMGLQFQGRKHDALDDAFNTFRIYRLLLEKLKKV